MEAGVASVQVHIALLSFASGAAEGEARPGEAEGAKASRLQTISNSFWSNLNRCTRVVHLKMVLGLLFRSISLVGVLGAWLVHWVPGW